jgi:hypothetical protein
VQPISRVLVARVTNLPPPGSECNPYAVVVLPHTVDAADLVEDAGPEVIWMCREMRSFAHVMTHTSHPENVYLAGSRTPLSIITLFCSQKTVQLMTASMVQST